MPSVSIPANFAGSAAREVVARVVYAGTVRLFPYERLTLHSDSAPEVVAARLATMVWAPRFFENVPADTFVGTIRGTHFRVSLEPPKAFSWRTRQRPPVIVGDIVRGPTGSEIRLRVRPRMWGVPLALVFIGCLLWPPLGINSSGLAIFGAFVLLGSFFEQKRFWANAKRAQALLRGGLDCREVEAQRPLTR